MRGQADLLAMTDRWIANYFRQPDYLTIDGKLVVIVFTSRELRRDMGTDAVRGAFARMRGRARAAGLPGIYIIGVSRENTHLETLVHEGYDAGTGYNYPRAGMPDETALSGPYAAMVRPAGSGLGCPARRQLHLRTADVIVAEPHPGFCRPRTRRDPPGRSVSRASSPVKHVKLGS